MSPRFSASARAKGRETLERADVVAAGARVLEREGVQRVSMRAVAAELGASVSTLYWHVRSRDDLLGLILEESMAGIRSAPSGPSIERLLGMMRASRRVLLARPALVEILWRSGWQLGDESLRVADELIQLVAASGVPEAEVADRYYALVVFLFGFVAAELGSPGTGPYRGEHFPSLRRYGPAADASGMDARFEHGVRALMGDVLGRARSA